MASKASVRDGFGRAVNELGDKEDRVVVVSADLKESLRLEEFARRFPARFFEVGVAEQNMIGVAAGLALSGLVPFACTFACFSPTLTFGQIRQAVVESRTNVKIVGSHGGLMTGADGVSHQALEDVALMTSLPEMTVVVPADASQAYAATLCLAKTEGPAYLRLARPATADLGGPAFKIGKARVLQSGEQVTLVGCGPILAEGLAAARQLAREGIGLEVIDCATVKPLDKKTLLASVKKTGRVITLEDHGLEGGLGSKVAALLAEHQLARLKRLAVGSFAGSARDWPELVEKCGLSSQNVVKTVKEMIR